MIHSFEEALISFSLITTNFKNIKNDVHEFKSKKKGFYLAFFLCTFSLIRSPLILYFHYVDSDPEDADNMSKVSIDGQSSMSIKHEQFVFELILGDYAMKLGNSGAIVHIWWATYSLVGIIFRLVFLSSEYRDNHAIFTTFHPDNYSNLKLSSKNLQKLILHTKVLITVHKIFVPTLTLSATTWHTTALYYAGVGLLDANYSLVKTSAIFTHWFINYSSLWIWLYYTASMLSMTFTTFYLSCTYIKLRYEQVNERKEDPLRASTLIESKEKMWSFIRDHRQITDLVRNYNNSVKWILFCVFYIFAVALALGFVVIITGDFRYIWIQGWMVAAGLQQIVVLTAFPFIAGGVDTAATMSYGTLRTIQVANGRHYGSMLNHQVGLLSILFLITDAVLKFLSTCRDRLAEEDRAQLVKTFRTASLNSLVEEMCYERNRISFYCLDLFPFKSISTYEFIAATASIVILFIPLFD